MATSMLQKIQSAIRRYLIAGLDNKQVLQKLATEFPDVKLEHKLAAVEALIEESDIVAAEEEDQAKLMRRWRAKTREAEDRSGRAGMTKSEALVYMAGCGDVDALAMLGDLLNPESQALVAEVLAAAEWHPDWTLEDDKPRCRSSAEVNTLTKLIAAYRKRRI